jgi:urocanate hydratase
MYVSKFEMPPGQVKQEARADDVKKTLVIIDPMGARDSIGGYHPGYWTVDQYADFLQENQRALFTQTIVEVKRNVPSENYSIQRDGSISIHIDKKVNTSIVTLSCRAKWI